MSEPRLSRPIDILAALTELKKEIGPEAYVDITLSSGVWGHPAMKFCVYPRGIGHGDAAFRIEGDDFADLIDAARAKWADFIDTHTLREIRAMALAIIEITADQGVCTDAALRQKFNAELVQRLGDRAIADANGLAGNGPFDIVRLGAANEAAA